MNALLPVAALLLLAACSERPGGADAPAADGRAGPPSAPAAARPAPRDEPDPPDFDDPRLFTSLDSLRWSEWETPVRGDREARLRALGIHLLRTDSTGPREPLDPEMGDYDPYGEAARDFHFVDFSGDGVDDVIYDGIWFMQGDNGVGALEGSHVKLYQVMNGRAVQVMDHHAAIQRIWKGRAGEPLSFRGVHYGCCGDVEWTIHYFRPVRAGDTVRFEPVRRVLGREEIVMPERFMARPRRFTVARDRYLLREAPVIDTVETGDYYRWEGHGNALAEYGRGARGTALAERTDAGGRTWWFVRMDGRTPPRDAQAAEPQDEHGRRVRTDRLGWMSSRFLDAEP